MSVGRTGIELGDPHFVTNRGNNGTDVAAAPKEEVDDFNAGGRGGFQADEQRKKVPGSSADYITGYNITANNGHWNVSAQNGQVDLNGHRAPVGENIPIGNGDTLTNDGHGNFTIRQADGTTYSGQWQNGSYNTVATDPSGKPITGQLGDQMFGRHSATNMDDSRYLVGGRNGGRGDGDRYADAGRRDRDGPGWGDRPGGWHGRGPGDWEEAREARWHRWTPWDFG